MTTSHREGDASLRIHVHGRRPSQSSGEQPLASPLGFPSASLPAASPQLGGARKLSATRSSSARWPAVRTATGTATAAGTAGGTLSLPGSVEIAPALPRAPSSSKTQATQNAVAAPEPAVAAAGATAPAAATGKRRDRPTLYLVPKPDSKKGTPQQWTVGNMAVHTLLRDVMGLPLAQ